MDRHEAYERLLKMELPESHYQTGRLPFAEQKYYLDQHFDRFWYTTTIVKKYLAEQSQPEVMEVGGFPFYLSALISAETGAHLTSIDIGPDPTSKTKPTAHQFWVTFGDQVIPIRQLLANIEREQLPLRHEMDLVIFTEVLEHLTLSPDVALENIHRALKQDGILILTTPNAHYLMKILSLLSGKNLYEPYQARWGIYGRHNREYLLWELRLLLEAHHFRILEAHYKNFAKPHLVGSQSRKYQAVDNLTRLPLLKKYQEGLILIAQKYGETVRVQPDFLFRN